MVLPNGQIADFWFETSLKDERDITVYVKCLREEDGDLPGFVMMPYEEGKEISWDTLSKKDKEDITERAGDYYWEEFVA